jgi:Ni,Fe-hydrogenase I large subunit
MARLVLDPVTRIEGICALKRKWMAEKSPTPGAPERCSAALK